MTKQCDKRICWNCDGAVSFHLDHCPYCAADLTQPHPHDNLPYRGRELGSPFQQAPREVPEEEDPFRFRSSLLPKSDEGSFAVTKEEWQETIDEKEPEGPVAPPRGVLLAFALLLPGTAFLLFGLLLVLFAKDGVLVLQWKQSLAFFYFLASLPLLYLGWRAAR